MNYKGIEIKDEELTEKVKAILNNEYENVNSINELIDMDILSEECIGRSIDDPEDLKVITNDYIKNENNNENVEMLFSEILTPIINYTNSEENLKKVRENAIQFTKALDEIEHINDSAETPYTIYCVENEQTKSCFGEEQLIKGWIELLNNCENFYAVVADSEKVVFESSLVKDSIDLLNAVIEQKSQENNIDLSVFSKN